LYCYIGKKEELKGFSTASIEIEWKSSNSTLALLHLDDDNMVEHLAENIKDKNWAQEMMD
jgi:hypothetical protein